MTSDEFRTEIREVLSSKPQSSFLTDIPSGSGVFRIANTTPENYDPAYISLNAGRWNKDGEMVNYLANTIDVCRAELGHHSGSEDTKGVIEVYTTTTRFPAFDVSKLPDRLKAECYSETGLGKHVKSQILTEEIDASKNFSGVEAIYAPSASGEAVGLGGMCLAHKMPTEHMKLMATGDYAAWNSGAFDRYYDGD